MSLTQRARTPGLTRVGSTVGRAPTLGRRATPARYRPHPAVLDECVLWLDAEDGSASAQSLPNRGWGGSALDAQFGSTTGADTNDPLWLPWGGGGYAYVAQRMTTPDEVGEAGATELDIRMVIKIDGWRTSSFLLSHVAPSGATAQAFQTKLSVSGALQLITSTDGTALVTATSSAVISTSVDLQAIRMQWRSSDGRVQFFTKDTTTTTAAADMAAHTGWSQLGADRTGVTGPIFNATGLMEMFGIQAGSFATGYVCGWSIATTIDGSPFLSVNIGTDVTSAAATSFTATTGQTVTVNRATSGRKTVLVPAGSRPLLLFGTDDYLEIPDSDLLDFGASDSFTAWAVGRQWATFGTNDALIAKKANTTNTTAGWLLGAGSTAAQMRLQVGDGTLGAEAVTGSRTSGTLYLAAGVRDVGADTLTGSLNATAGSPVTDATTATSGNAEVVRIGRLSGAGTEYSDTELLAAGIARRALTAGELYAIGQHYAAVA